MTSSFSIRLDTATAVGAVINGGNSSTSNTTVTLELAYAPDVQEVKIWGDINPLDPGNAGMGETEGDAIWMSIEEAFLVATTTNPGAKHLHVRVRDDVWNEATADVSIVLEGEGPPVPPGPKPTPPKPAGGLPAPPRKERRQVTCSSPAGRATTRMRLRARREALGAAGGGPVSVVLRLQSRHHIGGPQFPTDVESSVRARLVAGASVAPTPAGSRAGLKKRDGAEFIATLESLGIL